MRDCRLDHEYWRSVVLEIYNNVSGYSQLDFGVDVRQGIVQR